MEVVHSWHFTISMLNCFQIEVLVRWMVELAGQTLIAKCGLRFNSLTSYMHIFFSLATRSAV